MVKSSRAKICPLTVTFFPRAAEPLRMPGSGSKVLDGDDMVLVTSLLCGSTAGAGVTGALAGFSGRCGGSSSSFRLLHMQRESPRKCSIHRTTPHGGMTEYSA